MLRKTFDIVVKEKRKDGGRILISTGVLDRDRDRVVPEGAYVENYLKNPVVQWGHNYRDPWATVGKTTNLEITSDGITADFELRPPANEHDPQNVVLLLWNGDWVRTASIGFDVGGVDVEFEKAWEENEEGGRDYTSWELLEWSLVPIPANQEALRLAVKAMGDELMVIEETAEPLEPSAYHYVLDAKSGSSTWVSTIGSKESGAADVAWIRRAIAESDQGEQTVFAAFHRYDLEIPEDATKLDFDEDGDLIEVPHPDAGETITRKEVNFVPPIRYTSEKWGDDAVYSISGEDQADEELIKVWDDEYEIKDLSEILLSLSDAKSWGKRPNLMGLNVCRLTRSRIVRIEKIIGARLNKADAEDEQAAGNEDDEDAPSENGAPANAGDIDAVDDTDTGDVDAAPALAGDTGLTPEDEAALAEALAPFIESLMDQIQTGESDE